MNKEIILTIGSMTHALKAKRILARIGLKASLLKLDGTDVMRGCSYGISFPEEFQYIVAEKFMEAGISYSHYERNFE